MLTFVIVDTEIEACVKARPCFTLIAYEEVLGYGNARTAMISDRGPALDARLINRTSLRFSESHRRSSSGRDIRRTDQELIWCMVWLKSSTRCWCIACTKGNFVETGRSEFASHDVVDLHQALMSSRVLLAALPSYGWRSLSDLVLLR